MPKNKRRKRKGFTLVELIAVIAIIGILATIAIPRFGGFTASAKEGAVEANHRTIVSAAQLYYANNKTWPKKLEDLFNENGYLTQSDFYDNTDEKNAIPEGAAYGIGEGENGSCLIVAQFNEKYWAWDSDKGFIVRGEKDSDNTKIKSIPKSKLSGSGD